MSKIDKRTIRCENCNEVFDVDVYESINVTLDPEFREKVMNGDIYNFVCPHCGKEHYIQYPFLYHDMEHKFMIKAGTLESLMEYHDTFLNEAMKKVNKDFPGVLSGITQVGVDSYKELISKIVMLENGLDYRIGTIYCILMEQQYNKIISLDQKLKEQNAHVCDSFFVEYEGKPVVILDVDLNDENHTHKTPGEELDMNIYNKLVKDFSDKVNNVFSYCFNRDIAYKLLTTKDEYVEDLKATIMEVAAIELSNGEEKLAFIPEFNEGKFTVGDLVCVMKDMQIAKGTVKRIFNMDRYSLPLDLDDMPVVAYKTKNIEITTTGNSDDELDNSKLKEMFEQYETNGSLNEELMMNSNVIVGSITTMELADWLDPNNTDEFIRAMTNEDGNIEIPVGSTTTKMVTYYSEDLDAKLFCIYLEQKELTNEEASRLVYNLDDVINIVLNNPDKYDGIIINPESDKVVISNKRLVKYKFERTMTNSKLVKKLLLELKPEEISYIGQFRYDVIFKVYFEDTSPKKIAEEMNVPFEAVDEAIGYGYRFLKHIIWDNY